MKNSKWIDYPVELIRKWIAAGETQEVIANRLAVELDPRVTAKSIYKVCRKHGIECQRTGPRDGAGHPSWRGGRHLDRNGYVLVYEPDHPACLEVNERRRLAANGGYHRKDRYIQEHRLVMEKHIGRALLPAEVVHHRNNNKTDNRIENLQLFDSNARHLAETLRGKCPKWTPRGVANMRAAAVLESYPGLAQQFDYRQVAILLLAIQKELKLDVPPSKIEIDHYLARLGTTAVRACEMALVQERSQTD